MPAVAAPRRSSPRPRAHLGSWTQADLRLIQEDKSNISFITCVWFPIFCVVFFFILNYAFSCALSAAVKEVLKWSIVGFSKRLCFLSVMSALLALWLEEISVTVNMNVRLCV